MIKNAVSNQISTQMNDVLLSTKSKTSSCFYKHNTVQLYQILNEKFAVLLLLFKYL